MYNLNEYERQRRIAESTKKLYPPGTRIELLSMSDSYAPVPSGTRGTVKFVDSMGNKTSVLHILYALFPLIYERYIEPFGGSGAVLLGKKKPDKFEVYNDYNHNLVNLFR